MKSDRMTKPLVSVLIDTHNHEKYIEQAVVSALEQDFPADDYEIVVVDDGSTDRTPEIVRKFAPRVRLLRKKNGGQASAFNAAVPELRGEMVSFLDGDDWFAPGKLRAAMEALEVNPQAAAAGHGHYEVREGCGEMTTFIPRGRLMNLATPGTAREAFVAWRCTLPGALTVRRKVLETCMPIEEELTFCADAPIAVTAMAMGVQIVEKPLFYYRVHATNLFAVGQEDAAKLRRRHEMLERVYHITKRRLVRLGVSREAMAPVIEPPWIEACRFNLGRDGGSRLKTFRTEMSSFRFECENPSLRYKAFKYLLVGTATLVLSPRQFYKAREWYGRRNLGSLRERLVSAGGSEPVSAEAANRRNP